MREETGYSRNIGKFDDMTDREKYPFLIKMRDRFEELVEDGKILDAGCGHGRDTDNFESKGFRATGIDLGSEAVEYARENYRGRFLQMDVTDLDFDSRVFNGIWCSAVLQLLNYDKRRTALKEFNRVLKDEGVIFLTLKEGEGTQEKEKWGESFTHYLMSKEDAEEIISKAGFDLIDQTSNKSGENSFINYFCRPSGSK